MSATGAVRQGERGGKGERAGRPHPVPGQGRKIISVGFLVRIPALTPAALASLGVSTSTALASFGDLLRELVQHRSHLPDPSAWKPRCFRSVPGSWQVLAGPMGFLCRKALFAVPFLSLSPSLPPGPAVWIPCNSTRKPSCLPMLAAPWWGDSVPSGLSPKA